MPTHPALAAVVASFATRVPWLGVSLRSAEDDATSAQTSHLVVACPTSPESTPMPEACASPLSEALDALDAVLTEHARLLLSDLHRGTYCTYARMCLAYIRWKRTFAHERL